MAPPSIQESVESILTSLASLDTLRFHSTSSRVAAAVLHKPEIFEGGWIRDAEEHERGLFSTVSNAQDADSVDPNRAVTVPKAGEAVIDKDRLRRSILSRSTAGYRQYNDKTSAWAIPRRKGPDRVAGPPTATPLKKRRPAAQEGEEDPEPYLIAARKLLEH